MSNDSPTPLAPAFLIRLGIWAIVVGRNHRAGVAAHFDRLGHTFEAGGTARFQITVLGFLPEEYGRWRNLPELRDASGTAYVDEDGRAAVLIPGGHPAIWASRPNFVSPR